MEFFYNKETDLDEENNFTIELAKNNIVEDQKFVGVEEYLISGLELKPRVQLYLMARF